jgi:hypothetical protein
MDAVRETHTMDGGGTQIKRVSLFPDISIGDAPISVAKK